MAEEELTSLDLEDDEHLSFADKPDSYDDEGTDDEKEPESFIEERARRITLIRDSLIVAFLISAALVIWFSRSPSRGYIDPNESFLPPKNVVEEIDFDRNKTFKQKKIDAMLANANILLEQNKKADAVKIYNDIAMLNETLSLYNLGVTKMKLGEYSQALEYFKQAIENDDHKCLSAINAAAANVYLGNRKQFYYYRDLAYSYLPDELRSPLYGYYVGLVNYYKNFQYEALSALSNKDNQLYAYEKNYLLAKIFSSTGMAVEAVNALEGLHKPTDLLTMGLLQAGASNFEQANKYLQRAADKKIGQPIKVRTALMHVQNKLNNFGNVAGLCVTLLARYGDRLKDVYPTVTKLKETLFDTNYLQEEFRGKAFFSRKNEINMLFYFAPFQLSDSQNALLNMRKGGISSIENDSKSAQEFLKEGATKSHVAMAVSQGAKLAFAGHIKEANTLFSQMQKIDPYSATLNYDLALTYAQLGDFEKANKHFKSGYHLDNKNVISGIFAVLTGEFIHKDESDLIRHIAKRLKTKYIEQNKVDTIENALYEFTVENQAYYMDWIDNSKNQTPFETVLSVILANKVNQKDKHIRFAQKLSLLKQGDIMANIIRFNAINDKTDMKEYSKKVQIEFLDSNLNKKPFFYGPVFLKEQYVKLLKVAGLLKKEKFKISQQITLEKTDLISMLSTLAYINIYTKDFEEAYVIYNKLIDDLDTKDTHTLFHASVAAIGAGHKSNAAALLKLAITQNISNFEAQYGLALLQQEEGNYRGAAYRYKHIGNHNNFVPEFFTFDIKPRIVKNM